MTSKEATAQRLRESIAYLERKGEDRLTREERQRLAGFRRSLEVLKVHPGGHITFLRIEEENRWTRG